MCKSHSVLYQYSLNLVVFFRIASVVNIVSIVSSVDIVTTISSVNIVVM